MITALVVALLIFFSANRLVTVRWLWKLLDLRLPPKKRGSLLVTVEETLFQKTCKMVSKLWTRSALRFRVAVRRVTRSLRPSSRTGPRPLGDLAWDGTRICHAIPEWSTIDIFEGKTKLPKRVYAGSTVPIAINFRLSAQETLINGKDIGVRETVGSGGASRTLASGHLLQVEFLAAGIQVQGDTQQFQDLNLPRQSYHWSCYFGSTGTFTLSFIFRLRKVGVLEHVGTLDHTVKVVRIDGLMDRHISAIKWAAAAIGGVLAIVEILHRLGVW